MALCGIGSLENRWDWWFPALVVVTLGPPGSLIGDYVLRRKLQAEPLGEAGLMSALEAVTWDLSHLLDVDEAGAGDDEATVAALLERADERAAGFAERHEGRVAELDGDGLRRRWRSWRRSRSWPAGPPTSPTCASPPTPRTRPTAPSCRW